MSITIKDLSMKFPDGKQALKGISLEFKENQITGLIGFNGSGKTTTFNILAGFLEDYSGQVTFDGKPLSKEIKGQISYLSAGAEPKNPMKVLTHLYGLADLYNVKKAEAKKIIDDISKRIDFGEFLNKPIKSLSKGNQQKIKVIAVFLNPNLKYLFLDEPFDGLDPIIVKKIQKIFMELKGVTTIITSHQMDVVQDMCKEFFVLKDGILVSAQKIDNSHIVVAVNKEVSIEKVSKLPFVIEVTTKDKDSIIVIDDIKNFKELNKLLISDKNYIYSTIKDVNLAQEVFERYGA